MEKARRERRWYHAFSGHSQLHLGKTGSCSTQSSFVVSIGHAVNTKDRWMSQGLFRMVSTVSAYCTEQDGEQERAGRCVAAYA
jgi:hypothetical protein